MGQELVLSPILLAIYLVPFLHILEKHLKILKIPVSILSFVNDGLLVAQSKSFSISNPLIFCSYNIVSSLLVKFGLHIEHFKTEVFHFTRLHGSFNPLSRSLMVDFILFFIFIFILLFFLFPLIFYF